jgi:hypothetical protein
MSHKTKCEFSFWEEIKLNSQIQALVSLSKMRSSTLEYVCKVTFLINKDGSKRFCGDYKPLNLQTKRDIFPMPLVDDVLN